MKLSDYAWRIDAALAQYPTADRQAGRIADILQETRTDEDRRTFVLALAMELIVATERMKLAQHHQNRAA